MRCQTPAAKIANTIGRTQKGDAVSKLIESLTALCHARSVHRELFKLPQVEKIFCSLHAACVNSRGSYRAGLLRLRERDEGKHGKGKHRKIFLHVGSINRPNLLPKGRIGARHFAECLIIPFTDRCLATPMCAFGPKRTSVVAMHLSAFGGKADDC